jgi:hypothetical protein
VYEQANSADTESSRFPIVRCLLAIAVLVLLCNNAAAQSPGLRPARRFQTQPSKDSAVESGVAQWSFAHPSPAILVSLNVGSLLRSPVWTELFGVREGSGADWNAADLERARAALSEIGQVFISMSRGGAASPSVLMLARGNIDSALGAALRSGGGLQAKRLDAITMLLGDAPSLEMAANRMRADFARMTSNLLQQTAAREAQKYDLWVGVDPRHLASLASAFGGVPNQGFAVLSNFRAISVGLYLRDQIRLEAALDAGSPDIANRLLANFQQTKQQDPFGTQVWSSAEGATVRFIAIVDANRLRNVPGLDSARAQMTGWQMAPLIRTLAGLDAARQSTPAEPSTAAPAAIVIQGLGGGPKELPAK